jgi:hypothetical protein
LKGVKVDMAAVLVAITGLYFAVAILRGCAG